MDSGLADWEPTLEDTLRYLRLHSAALKLASRALFLRCRVSISSCSSALEREPLRVGPAATEPLLLCSIFTQSVKLKKKRWVAINPGPSLMWLYFNSSTKRSITLVLSEGGDRQRMCARTALSPTQTSALSEAGLLLKMEECWCTERNQNAS